MAHPPEASFTRRHADLANGASDEALAHRPLAASVAYPVAMQVVALDEPGVETGQHLGRRSGHFGVDGHDRRTDEPVGGPGPGQRIEALDGDRPVHRGGRDTDLGSRLDERLLVDHVGRRERARLLVGELAGPPEHAPDGVAIEHPLCHQHQVRAPQRLLVPLGPRATHEVPTNRAHFGPRGRDFHQNRAR